MLVPDADGAARVYGDPIDKADTQVYLRSLERSGPNVLVHWWYAEMKKKRLFILKKNYPFFIKVSTRFL